MATDDPDLDLSMHARDARLPGGLHVRRALPRRQRRSVGPFVFVDQMGPEVLDAAREIVVLPHPHIGLSTLTYLFEGEGMHRDSLGTQQCILPGEVNWMTAGRGIVHSERMRAGATGRLFGVQIWVALPQALETCEPSFQHYGRDAVPVWSTGGATITLIAGSLLGHASGVRVPSPLVYASVQLEADAEFALPAEQPERAVFVLEGRVELSRATLHRGEIGFLHPDATPVLRAREPALLLLLGGEPLDGPRQIRWNFVSSSPTRIEQAGEDWRQQRFPRVPGETAYIPLPEDGETPVDYP